MTTITLKDLPAPPPNKIGWPWTEANEPLSNKMPDGSQYPLISIVTPSYNYGQFIEETIRSVLLQGYPNLEYIVIDGGSTDDTVEIIKKYEQYLTYWVSEPDEGQTDAINKGYQHCSGDIFVWLNADDAYADANCLQEVSKYYQQGYQLIVGECLNVDEKDKPIKITDEYNGHAPPQNFDQYLKFWSYVWLPQPAVFIAKELTDKSFPLDKSIYCVMDYQFFLKVLSHRPQSIFLNKTWVKFKYHGENKSLAGNRNGTSGYLELYQVALTESRKVYNSWDSFRFKLDADDFMAIQSILDSDVQPSFKSAVSQLISRPTLIRWKLFWKVFTKSFLGPQMYSNLKNFAFYLVNSFKFKTN